MRTVLFVLLVLCVCVHGQSLFSFLPSSFRFRESFSYGYGPSPDEENAARRFTKWSCSEFSPEAPQTYTRESPSPNSFETRFSDPFYAFERIGRRPQEEGIYRDPNGFDPSTNPFTSPSESSWVGGKNRPGFSYPSESYLSNRGIASIFGRGFGIVNRRSSYSTFTPGPYTVIPLCSALMPTIISAGSSLFISSGLVLLVQFVVVFL
uniref:Uncharacterized protein n=1 Tax=Vannella robusta TaxID=1487602 RepID=A0A7S4MQA2_9EUKA|mmetsp:Transcript_6876/g.8555  ORF Transcript_6876/g.8555 Transcript_6876/m.8555 type:complete len:207 (+) Transcript_6876:421-1041(+)